MGSRRFKTVLFVVFAVMAAGLQRAHAEILYDYLDLGTFGGRSSRAYDINNRGQVVGYAERTMTGTVPVYEWDPADPFGFRITGYTQGTVTRTNAFVYDYRRGTMVSLGEPTEHSEAYAINDSGQIVGSVGFSDDKKKAFVAKKGFIRSFSLPSGPIDSSVAKDINNAGQIVGNSYSPGYAWFSTSYHSLENATVYQSLLGAASHVNAINSQGQIVGFSYLNSNSTGPVHATLLSGQTVTDLRTLGVGRNSYAWDINDLGQVAGTSEYQQSYPSSMQHAVIFSGGTIQDLGTLHPGEISWANAINNLGEVVGQSGWAGFLYKNGQMYDLNQLTSLPAGWSLYSATGINDLGQIVGYARDESGATEHAFLLTPHVGVNITGYAIDVTTLQFSMASTVTPEPGTLVLCLAGFGMVGLFGLRRVKRQHRD